MTGRIPAVIRVEDVVDVSLQVVALVAEVDAACGSRDHAVAEKLGLQLVLVLVEGLDELLNSVTVGVDAHQYAGVRAGHQRLEG